MFGTKIRSWMEAHIVRPRKKQHRSKDQTSNSKKRYENGVNIDTCITKDDNKEIKNSELTLMPVSLDAIEVDTSMKDKTALPHVTNQKQVTLRSADERGRMHNNNNNNNNNLSSPESAYSTGYSTDGTSPGGSFPATTAPPEYYINIRTGIRYFHSPSGEAPTRMIVPEIRRPWDQIKPPPPENPPAPVVNKITSPALNSPRQRNRIRTNPWVPETTQRSSCKCSPINNRLTPTYTVTNNVRQFRNGPMCHVINTSSPVRKKWTMSDKKQHISRFTSSSSSSTSSISSVHAVRVHQKASSEEDDDRTLNEMMGKYDESYIYEKETDILSDSDPTDCDEDYNDSDAEDGREGGDERDLMDDDEDFDFIDNGSLELNVLEDGTLINKGHCTYHVFHEGALVHRETSRVSRRNMGTPTNLRHRRSSERRIRRASSKKKRERYPALETQIAEFNKLHVRSRFPGHLDGSRSAGATPVSVRRRRALDEYHESRYEKRCNSVSYNGALNRRPGLPKPVDYPTLTEKDKEADKKYKELIIEAEHILMSMKTFRGPSIGSPKRDKVGLPNKRVELLRNLECGTEMKPIDPLKEISKPLKDLPKFSPKKNHITNFINNNSPIIPRRDESLKKEITSPLAIRKHQDIKTPIVTFKPLDKSLSLDNNSLCPQSEPVKRKIYCNNSLNTEIMLNDSVRSDRSIRVTGVRFEDTSDGTVFQQQKLFQTLTSLKRNLESQSEALRQSCYGSSQRLPR